jgi:hypothetical protein
MRLTAEDAENAEILSWEIAGGWGGLVGPRDEGVFYGTRDDLHAHSRCSLPAGAS